MFEYQLHEIRHAELVRRAESEWLARHVRRADHTGRRPAGHGPEGRVSDSRNRHEPGA
ncbi:hypothetical protein ABZ532_27320 [Streptomyces sp. NPDC019396]|uniref:hypothetical protein n=1 Tax=Streptomyces sp. NPDC019396 TaxID=3154687 RepID=UPI0033EB411B